MLFIKRFSDFETVAALTPLSSSLCIDSAEQEGSTVTVVGNGVQRSLAGSWAVINGMIYTITTVTPQDGRTLLALAAPGEAFSRLLPYTAPASGSGGAFAAAELTANYINQPDKQYALPYLSVSNLDTWRRCLVDEPEEGQLVLVVDPDIPAMPDVCVYRDGQFVDGIGRGDAMEVKSFWLWLPLPPFPWEQR